MLSMCKKLLVASGKGNARICRLGVPCEKIPEVTGTGRILAGMASLVNRKAWS